MAINTNVYVAYDPRSRQFTFTGGNTVANDGSVILDQGYGNQITYVPTGNRTDWSLIGIVWMPNDGVLSWQWLNGAQNGSIVVTDQDVGVRSAVTYEITMNAQEFPSRYLMAGGPVVINKPADGMAEMRASSGSY